MSDSQEINVLVTGANGQLGSEFRALAKKNPAISFVFMSQAELPITDTLAIERVFSTGNFDVCINCAAYTAVDKAEADSSMSSEVNAHAVGQLSHICNHHSVRLIHFSTDYVFDGSKKAPYVESDQTSPINNYGQSKLNGETLALKYSPKATVIRTSWLYSSFGNNFVKTMLRLMKEKQRIGVVDDQVGCPTYAADLAETVVTIIANTNFPPGVYHYCNKGAVSWYEFASAIKSISNSACEVYPIPTSAYPTPAKRPVNSVLDTSKIQETLKIEIPFWKTSLEKCLHLLTI